MRGAEGLRVLEAGTRLSGAFAGLILSAQGADVCQIRDGLHRELDEFESAYFDRGRRVVPLDGDLRDLLQAADVVLTDLSPRDRAALNLPETTEALAAVRPGLVHVAISSLGLTGPHAGFVMDDITEWASGGLAFVTRRPVPDGDTDGYRPVLAPDRQPEMMAGIAAATAALAAVRLARNTGEAVIADVSRQEVQAAMLHGIVPPFVWNATVTGSPSARLSNIGMLLPAADGSIYFRTVEAHQWQGLVEWMGTPEWTREPWVADPLQRRANWDIVHTLIGEWTAQHPRQWLVEEGQRRRVPVALPREPRDVLASEQLAALGIWQDIPAGESAARAPVIPLVDDGTLGPARACTAADILAEWK